MIQFHRQTELDEIDDFSVLSEWIIASIEHNSCQLGELNLIFVSDEDLLKINREYLDHDYYTDVITFDYKVGEIISGDIYISVDRVRENSKEYNESFTREFCRVIIHGVLHLIGLDDKTEDNQKEMRKQEDFLLNLCPIL